MAEHTLAGTVAVVTGASSGIGEATALALSAEGAAVAVVARRSDRLEALATRIRAGGGSVLVHAADVADPSAAAHAVDDVVSRLGRIDIVVNNAGLMLLGRVERMDPSGWRRMLDVNVAALMTMSKLALPHLLEAAAVEPRHVADIVNVSSVAGRVARAGSGAYNASKWAVNAFSEALRQEVTQQHIRVALVEPGVVDTELMSHNADPEVIAGWESRFGSIERLAAADIAEAVRFVVTRPRHVAINELLVRPTEQVG